MSARFWKVTAVLVLAFSLIALQWFQFDASRHHSSTSFSDGPLGTSIFLDLARQFAPQKVSILKHAIYSPDDLGGESAVLIISSPLGELSSREAGIVRTFVSNGGILLLSCHDESCQESVSRMATELGSPFIIEVNQSYHEAVPERVSIEENELFPAGEYAFYTARSFYGDGSQKYLRRTSLGRGAVLSVSSVVPLANGLIGQADNWRLAERIIRQSSAIVIDEYHHFFSERNFGDLIMTPWVTLPMLGLLLAALSFFIFGEEPSNFDELERVRVPSFHRFNQDALRGLLKDRQVYKDAILKQLRVVQRAQAVGGHPLRLGANQTIRELAERHRDLLRQKRGQIV